RRVLDALRADHRHPQGEHRPQDVAELRAAGFRGLRLMDLAERTLQLCRIRSPVGEEAEIAAHVAAETDGERIGNAVVCGAVTGARPAILLAGHLDTVPLQEGDFPARRKNGRVYGRGASDMKGALAEMIELWQRLDRVSLTPQLSILSIAW